MKKKLIGLTLLAVLTLMLAPTVFAAEQQEPTAQEPTIPALASYYLEFSGKITEINSFYNVDGSESGRLFVLTENADGMLMNFVVDEETVLVTENELKVGADITGFYLSNAPMLLIYPPQTRAAVLVVGLPAEKSVKAALFDADLLSDDADLKLNIGDNTEILLQNGEAAPKDIKLANRRLVVLYSITTRSIPAQTTPERIIVLDELEEQPLPQEEFATDGMPISVENVLLTDAPPVYVHDSGAVMIPLRAVAEALGYTVGWQNGVVTLDGQAVIVIGQDTYAFADSGSLQLPTAAELRNGATYVPLSFFREVLKVNNAYVLEQQVYIDNGEKME